MSKMRCLCGGLISNVVCPCPTEGWILRDQDQDGFCDVTSRDIAAFLTAIQANSRNAWIAEYFSPHYPNDVSDQAVIYDIISHRKRQVVLSIAECEQCGRLWVQHMPEVNEYGSYLPDKPGYAGVLRSRNEDQGN